MASRSRGFAIAAGVGILVVLILDLAILIGGVPLRRRVAAPTTTPSFFQTPFVSPLPATPLSPTPLVSPTGPGISPTPTPAVIPSQSPPISPQPPSPGSSGVAVTGSPFAHLFGLLPLLLGVFGLLSLRSARRP